MAASLKVEIITPEAKVFEGQAEFVELPGAEGDMGVFPQHEATVTELKAGELARQPITARCRSSPSGKASPRSPLTASPS